MKNIKTIKNIKTYESFCNENQNTMEGIEDLKKSLQKIITEYKNWERSYISSAGAYGNSDTSHRHHGGGLKDRRDKAKEILEKWKKIDSTFSKMDSELKEEIKSVFGTVIGEETIGIHNSYFK